jgi:peptide deformylase
MSNKNQHCSFCGKPKEETKRLITGPDGACICDECIEICKSMVDEWTEEKETQEEGCLSLPGLSEKVTRPTRIRVSYLDENFQEHDEWVDGFLARVLQHEFDHLDGVVYTDHLKGLRRQLMAPKLKQLVKGIFSADYKVKPLRK